MRGIEHTMPSVGCRVRFLGFGEPEPSRLAIGCKGTVAFIDSVGTIHVDWDTGVRLGVVVRAAKGRRADRIVVLGDTWTTPPEESAS